MTSPHAKSALALIILAVTASTPASANADILTSEATLCRSQLELLMDRQRVIPDEIARFDAQCACLEEWARAGDPEGRQICTQRDAY